MHGGFPKLDVLAFGKGFMLLGNGFFFACKMFDYYFIVEVSFLILPLEL